MTNPYNSFDQGRDGFYSNEEEAPRPQSYAEYQESLNNPQPNPRQQFADPRGNIGQQAYDPFQQQPMAGAPAPYAHQSGLIRNPGQPKSWVATVLLTGFLGTWGAHNFYLGYRNRAVTQLVMTLVGYLTAIFLVGFVLLGAVAIWAFVDFVRVLLRSGEYGVDADGVPLT
jgi:TM2 domain-containing membrane protein YozV